MKTLYTKFILLGLFCFLGTSLSFGQNITTIDFEVDGEGYSTTDSYGSGFTDFFNRTNSDLPNCTNEDGFFWGFEDMTSGNKVLDIDQINIAGATQFIFSIDMVAHHYDDWDDTDEFLITYSLDGGTYQNLMWVQHTGNNVGSNTSSNEPAALDTDFDGDGECGVGTTLPALTTGTRNGCTVSSSNFETFMVTINGLSGITTLDIRLTAVQCTATDEGLYFDNIVVNHNGGSSVDNPTSFSASEISSTQIDVSYDDNANGDNVIIVFNTDNTFTTASGGLPTVGASFAGGEVLYIGSGNNGTYNHTGLTENTTYYYRAFSYDATPEYSTGSDASATTLCSTPTEVTSLLTAANNGEVDIVWDNPTCFDEIIIVAKANSATSVNPSGDGSTYTADTAFGSGTDIGTNEYVVYKGTGTNTTVTNLTNSTTYHFTVFSRKNTSWSAGETANETPTITYCSGGPTDSADSEIENVTLVGVNTSISNDTSNVCTGDVGGEISDFTAQIADLEVNGTYTLSVEFGDCDGANQFDGQAGVWIDWNGDGDFEDVNEEIGIVNNIDVSNGNVIEDFTINVPANQPIGFYRMRIVQEELGGFGAPDPCKLFDYGAVEDYTIEIIAASTNDTDSEIDGPVLASQPDPTFISSLVDTDPEAIRVFDFDVYDFGTSDGLPTTITQVTINEGGNNDVDWSTHIENVKLSIDAGSTFATIGTPTINASSIVIPVTSGLSIADGDIEKISLYVYLKNSGLTDDGILEFEIPSTGHGFTADPSGSRFATSFTNTTTSNQILIDVEATELVFTNSFPLDVNVNSIFSLTVNATDENGNVDLDETDSITLSKTTGSGNLTGTLTKNLTNGSASFTDLQVDAIDTFTISTTSSSLTNVTSGNINATAAPVSPTAGSFFITEVADASSSGNEYIEFYNNTGNSIDLSSSKLVDQSFNTVWDFGDDIANVSVPAYGFLIVSRSSNESTFENAFGPLNSNTVFVQGTNGQFFGTGTLRRWQLWEGGTANTADGNLIDDTDNTVGGANNRTEQNIFDGTFATSARANANPGELDFLLYNGGAWINSNAMNDTTGASDAYFYDDFTLTSDAEINDVGIATGANFDIDPNQGLKANGDFTNNGAVTLHSNASQFSSLIVDGAASGNVVYKRFVNNTPVNDLISPPVSNQDWNAFRNTGSNATDLYRNSSPGSSQYAFGPFDKATGSYLIYDNTNNGDNISVGTGYRAATVSGTTLDFTGPLQTGNFSKDITIDNGASFSIWNLIGNPYTSYVDTFAFLSHVVGNDGMDDITNFDLLSSLSGIYAYDGDTSDGWLTINLIKAPDNPIAPGQAFFVGADATYTDLYDMVFTPEMRKTASEVSTSDDFISNDSASNTLTFLELKASTANNAYYTEFYFNPNASLGLDPGYDAVMFGGNAPSSFALYSHLVQDNVGSPFAIQALGSNDLSNVTIPLGINANAGEQLTFSIEEMQIPDTINIYLEDVVNNTVTLLNTSDYILTPSNQLTGTGRFYITFTNTTLSTLEQTLDIVDIYANNTNRTVVVSGELDVNTTATLFDLQGRTVMTAPLDASKLSNSINVAHLTTGVYIVQLTNASGSKTAKIILK